MIPKSLSASAVASFASCPARYKAEWIEKVPSIPGDAALLGTTCHSALEDFVSLGEAIAGEPLSVLEAHFTKHYWTNFSEDSKLSEGLMMMKKWHTRQDWNGVTVISTEKKECVMLPTSAGPMQFNFIIDRLDMLEDGSIKVVDYKSNWVPMTFEDLRSMPQPQVYGMAARLKYPEAPSIWVEFDFLRHQPIAVRVELEENRSTWNYLLATAESIIESDGTEEIIGKDCGWCVRRHTCKTLNKHIDGGGVLSIATDDMFEAAKRRMDLVNAEKAIKTMISDIDGILVTHMEHEGVQEFETPEVSVSLSSSRRREVDGQVVARVVGPEIYSKYADLKVGKLNEMVKSEQLDVEQIAAVEDQIVWRHNSVGIKVKARGPLDANE